MPFVFETGRHRRVVRALHNVTHESQPDEFQFGESKLVEHWL